MKQKSRICESIKSKYDNLIEKVGNLEFLQTDNY